MSTNGGEQWGASGSRALPTVLTAPFTGYWRRVWSRSVDRSVLAAAMALCAVVLALVRLVIRSVVESCAIRNGVTTCSGSDWLGWAFLAGLAVAWVGCWYLLIPMRIVRHGHSIGMGQLGLRMQDPANGANVTTVSATVACLVDAASAAAGAVVVVAGVVLVADGTLPRPAGVALLFAGLALWLVPGSLLMLATPRHQTFGDAIGGVTVVEMNEPTWFGLAALWCGQLLFPLAIVFGHIGLIQTRWDHGRRSGRGMALAGTLLGYSVPAVVLATSGYALAARKIEAYDSGNCREVRNNLTLSVESYRSLNGFYPATLAKVINDPYMVGDVDETRWEYAVGGSGDQFQLTGVGACDGV